MAALVFELPELAALAAPFALLALVGLLAAEAPVLRVYASLEPDMSRDQVRGHARVGQVHGAARALEGDSVELTIDVEADGPIERLELMLSLPPAISVLEGENPAVARLAPDRPWQHRLLLRCDRWGTYELGRMVLRAQDGLAFVRHELEIARPCSLKVFPSSEALQLLLRPLETQVFAGNQVARQKGDGIEFADMRPFVAGDRIRRVNWRASARRNELWVNEFHAERNADVILFLDSFTETRDGAASTLDLAVRAAAALAGRYLRHKDRVGLVSFGGLLNWLTPATGPAHMYRIVDALLDTEVFVNYAWKDIDVVPRRMLPAKALILALTPLLDERAIGALLDLRARGFDLVIVEISPIPFAEPGSSEGDRLAYRIWQLRREALRARYERAGVPVAVWRQGQGLAGALEEVERFRRHAPRSRV